MNIMRMWLTSTTVAFCILTSTGLTSAGDRGLGTEGRQWVAGPQTPPTSTERYPVTAQENVRVAMRDGVQLNSRLLLPTLPEGSARTPCILLINPYGHTSTPDSMLGDLVSRGYAGLHVSARGVGGSGGVAGLYDFYDEDGYDLVEWMAVQPWCNGNVGMIGGSRLGIPQWRTAREGPPHLKAIAPAVACGDCYFDHWYRGGTLPGPGRNQPPLYDIALQHRNFDAFWRERSIIKEDYNAIARRGIPAMVIGGWMDYLTPANIRAYRDFSAAGGQAKLIIGRWPHRTGEGLLPYDMMSYQALWFDHYLKGLDNGINQEPPVLIYVQGADQWRFEKAWPIPDTRAARLYLRALKSGSSTSLNDGSLTGPAPASGEASVSYSYDPVDGPFLATGVSQSQGRLTIDQRPDEAKVLTWTSRALAAPTEISGWMKFNFWASATQTDTDFILQITDVDPDGTSIQVTTGALNAPRYFDRTNPPSLESGKMYQYQMEIEPTSYVFKAGHRIRLDMAGGCKVAPEQPSPQGPGKNPHPSTVTIHEDASHPSYLEFPVIGTALLPTETFDGVRLVVDDLVQAGRIRGSKEKLIYGQIDRAAESWKKGRKAKADAQLQALEKQVGSYNPRFIDPMTADRLTAESRRLRTLLTAVRNR